MAPILSFTAEDISRYSSRVASIFLEDMPKLDNKYLDEKLESKWTTILEVREKVYRKVEKLRAAKEIGGSIDARVELFAKGKELELLRSVEDLLPLVLIVSQVFPEGRRRRAAGGARRRAKMPALLVVEGKHRLRPGTFDAL